MNTPAHVIFGLACFGKPDHRATLWAAALGGLAPDLSLYVMAGVALGVLEIPPSVVFGQLYFSDAWQTVFAIDNSFLLWGPLLALALWKGMSVLTAFAAAALLHVALDFPLHHDDGRPHFWPLSWWVFESPVSYWDTRHYAGIIGPLELVASSILAALAAWRIRTLGWVLLLAALVAAEAWIVRVWFQWLF
ncbi:cobalamin biosynthesis protein CobQ [Pseudaestuariivita sp.]|uniref:cobalamin biosynthesis protein CobQ n=1 Tax=Pseudaestuariivita sp. TaxID=2211669 RepID=UPI004059E496